MNSTDCCKVLFWKVFLEVFEKKGDFLGDRFHVFTLACYVQFPLSKVDVLDIVCVPCAVFLNLHCCVQFVV